MPRRKKLMFQVVPPHGGHRLAAAQSPSPLRFKSCPRMGGIRDQVRNPRGSQVSSRAPAWGASFWRNGQRGIHPGFKSCPRMGGIRSCREGFDIVTSFKSCPRMGGILFIIRYQYPDLGFKSCPRMGGIAKRLDRFSRYDFVSSRAPAWGASLGRLPAPAVGRGFKSCPRMGASL